MILIAKDNSDDLIVKDNEKENSDDSYCKRQQ